MQITLTPEEYRRLIELTYLGEWVVNAHHDPEYQDESASSLLQNLLSQAQLEGIEQDPETGGYFMDTDWTDRLYDQYVLDYDDHVFWDELTERLALRDLARRRGVAMEHLNRDDDLIELKPLEDRYRSELEDNGIERLDIREY